MDSRSPIAPPRRSTDRPSRRARGQGGAVSVELGILLPFLVIVFLAIIGIGLLYNAQVALQGAAREGARVLALDTGDPVAATQNAASHLGSDVNVTTSGDPCDLGAEASVTATYDYVFEVPFLDFSRTLSATGVMRCERRGS